MVEKKNIIALSIFFFIFLTLSTLTGVFFYWRGNRKKEFIKKENIYQNPFYGYEIVLPKWWRGKYLLEEGENRVNFIYVKDSKNPIEKRGVIFSIFVFSPTQKENMQEMVGGEMHEIYSDEKVVFLYSFSSENPYSQDSSSTEAEEFQKMIKEVEEIVKTFKYDPQKIPCARAKEKINKNPLTGPTIRFCCSDLVEWRESRSYSVCLLPDKEGIAIETPKENEKIKSPLTIKGKAKNDWFFEAQFTVQAVDEKGVILGTGILTATEDWRKEGFVSFEGRIEFFAPEKDKGNLLFFSANPSGLLENQKVFSLPVLFESEMKEGGSL